MSGLGQKQTFAVHQPMSALPPEADMCSALAHLLWANSGHDPRWHYCSPALRKPSRNLAIGPVV
jgi:hypothetical protein